MLAANPEASMTWRPARCDGTSTSRAQGLCIMLRFLDYGVERRTMPSPSDDQEEMAVSSVSTTTKVADILS